MSDDAKTWAARVGVWEASGQGAVKFAEGKGYSGAALYYWRRRLKQPVVPAAEPATMKIARVIRAPGGPGGNASLSSLPERGVIVESARLGLRVLLPSFEPQLFRDVVAVLGEGAKEGQR